MNTVLILAGKEIRDGMRNRWAVGATAVMAGLALALAFLGSAPTGHVGVPPLAVTVVSLSSLSVFLVPLIALILAHDALVGEIERGTMLLLLAYPVRRWQVVTGKFLGHLTLLGAATAVGYGIAGAAVAAAYGGGAAGSGLPGQSGGAWAAFVTLVAASVALGAAFLAIGYVLSATARERATAGGMAVAGWLVFVVLFDLALLGLLAATGGKGISQAAFGWVLLFDPADVFRMITLASFADVKTFAGLSGLPALAQTSPAVLVPAMLAWIAAPLALAVWLFSRRPL